MSIRLKMKKSFWWVNPFQFSHGVRTMVNDCRGREFKMDISAMFYHLNAYKNVYFTSLIFQHTTSFEMVALTFFSPFIISYSTESWVEGGCCIRAKKDWSSPRYDLTAQGTVSWSPKVKCKNHLTIQVPHHLNSFKKEFTFIK